MPRPFEVGALLNRFGHSAIFNRLLHVGEMRQIMHCEAVINAYRARDQYRDRDGAVNYSEWAERNKAASRLLNDAMKAAVGDG